MGKIKTYKVIYNPATTTKITKEVLVNAESVIEAFEIVSQEVEPINFSTVVGYEVDSE